MENLIKSFFFIPSNNQRFIEKSTSLNGIDHRVFDLEDSINSENLNDALLNLSNVEATVNDWIRIPTYKFEKQDFNYLIDLGFSKFIVPKLNNNDELELLIKLLNELLSDFSLILLIEKPQFLLNLQSTLQDHKDYVYGIGFGSHDFCAESNIAHLPSFIDPIRLKISLIAKSFSIISIDIASMNSSNKSDYFTELRTGFNMGYDAKFLIHPTQLSYLSEFPYFSKEQFIEAVSVLNEYNKLDDGKVVLSRNGKIYEKPHMNRFKLIKEWGKLFYGTNW